MIVYPFELALTFYFAACIIGVVEVVRHSKTTERLMLASMALAFVNHTVSIVYRYVSAGHLPITSPHEAASFFAWAIVLLFFIMEFRYKIGLIGAFLAPIIFFLMLASSLLSRDIKTLHPTLQSYWLGIHTFFAFTANAAFALACVIGIMYLVQEHYLKSKNLGDLFERLPDIQTLDFLGYRLISIGFPAMILAMITGSLWANSGWGSYWQGDPREVFSLITVLIYAVIIHTRLIAGWRGKRAAVLSILGFTFILLSFFGIKLMQKGLHVF